MSKLETMLRKRKHRHRRAQEKPRAKVDGKFAKAHSRLIANELAQLGWTLRNEFYAEGDMEPYEWFFAWDHPGDPVYPDSYSGDKQGHRSN
jgi:hypothetical protein